jgi:hypothetical protein
VRSITLGQETADCCSRTDRRAHALCGRTIPADGTDRGCVKDGCGCEGLASARWVVDGGVAPDEAEGRERWTEQGGSCLRQESSQDVVAPAFMIRGGRCGRCGRQRRPLPRATRTGARLCRLLAAGGFVPHPHGVRRLPRGRPGVGIGSGVRRADDDVVAATRPGGRGSAQAGNRQPGGKNPEAARRSFHPLSRFVEVGSFL